MAQLTRKIKDLARIAAHVAARAERLISISPAVPTETAGSVRFTAGLLLVLVTLLVLYFAGLLLTEDWIRRPTAVVDSITFVVAIFLGSGIFLVAISKRGAWAPLLMIAAAQVVILGAGFFSAGGRDASVICNYLTVVVLMGSLVLNARNNAVNFAVAMSIELLIQHWGRTPTTQRLDQIFFLAISGALIFTSQYLRHHALRTERTATNTARERLEGILNAVPSGVFEADERGSFVYTNERYAQVTGLSTQEASAAGWTRAVHPDDRGAVVANWQTAVINARSFSRDFRVLRPDGTISEVHVEAAPNLGPAGKLLGFTGALIDMSVQKRFDRDLRQSQRFMASLLDHLPVALTCRDGREGFRFVFVNKMAERIYGIAAHAMIGKPDASFQNPERLAESRMSDIKQLATGAVEEIAEEEVETPQGMHTLHVIKAVVPGDDGKPRYLLDLAEDLTERIEERRKLELYLRVAKEMSFGLIVFQPAPKTNPAGDARLVLKVANQAAEQFLGMHPAAAVAEQIDVLAADPALRMACTRLASGGGGTIDVGRIARPAYRGAPPQHFFVRAFTVEGNAVGVLCENITERVRAEAALESDRAKNIEASRLASLGEMAGGIAHEINNPLTVIQGKARMAAWLIGRAAVENGQIRVTASERDAIVEFMASVEKNAARIAKIIRGLRAITRDGHSDPLSPELVFGIIDDAMSLCRERILNHGIDLRADPAEWRDLSVACRATQIVQILVNLIANAQDAIVENTALRAASGEQSSAWIGVAVERDDRRVAFVISNSGAPISVEVRAKMFQPFFTTKDVGRGTGLGLSVSLGLAKDHGGTLAYDESSPFPRFILTLPRVALFTTSLATTFDRSPNGKGSAA